MSPTSRRETVDQRIEALLRDSDLHKPNGEGPFPIVLQFHGCGGKKNLQERWAAVAQTEVCQRWWKFMGDIMPSNPDNSPVSRGLNEVFHLA